MKISWLISGSKRKQYRVVITFLTWLAHGFFVMAVGINSWAASPDADIVFVTQVPHTSLNGAIDSGIVSCFHSVYSDPSNAPRGGDLYIRYRDGSLKNITKAAGYGVEGRQGNGAIAVRDPEVHWSGTKVLFSMVINTPGAPRTDLDGLKRYRWQLYEATGLGKTETPSIAKIPNQPEYNNMMPAYASDDSIIFVSDLPRQCEAHLYPPLAQSKYKAVSNSGLWKLEPETGNLHHLDHQPSGSFYPMVDSFGRVIFNHWDLHAADDDQFLPFAIDFMDESPNSPQIPLRSENFLDIEHTDLVLAWEMNQDGSSLETLNHIGRHELFYPFPPINALNDPTLSWQIPPGANIANSKKIRGLSQLQEDSLEPGKYYAVNAKTFQTHCAGQIVSFRALPGEPGNTISINYVTDPRSSQELFPANQASFDPIGLFRDPVSLSDGTLMASHTPTRSVDSPAELTSNFKFRLTKLLPQGEYYGASELLTPGIIENITQPDGTLTSDFSGPLWELQPVELRARPRPPFTAHPLLEEPERQVFANSGVDIDQFRSFLQQRNLALVVSRNVTARDHADRTQPFNLKVAKPGGTETIASPGPVHELAFLEVLQADAVREYHPGRREMPIRLHNGIDKNPPSSGGPGLFEIEADGSVAAIVPARRALTWRTTKTSGEPVVRELYWVTFQPGEVRVCASCHAVNETDQIGRPPPQNPPQALQKLLEYYRSVLLPQNGAPGQAEPPYSCNTKSGNISNDGNNSNEGNLISQLTQAMDLLNVAYLKPPKGKKPSMKLKRREIREAQRNLKSLLKQIKNGFSPQNTVPGYVNINTTNLSSALKSASMGSKRKLSWRQRKSAWKKCREILSLMLTKK